MMVYCREGHRVRVPVTFYFVLFTGHYLSELSFRYFVIGGKAIFILLLAAVVYCGRALFCLVVFLFSFSPVLVVRDELASPGKIF